MLMSYERRRGHDYKGHFCQPGQPEEVIAIVGPVKFSREDFSRYVIEGTMIGWMSIE